MFLSSPRGGGSAIRRLGEKLMWVYIILSNVNNKTNLCQVLMEAVVLRNEKKERTQKKSLSSPGGGGGAKRRPGKK